jgi:hypothetical protein
MLDKHRVYGMPIQDIGWENSRYILIFKEHLKKVLDIGLRNILTNILKELILIALIIIFIYGLNIK